MWIDLILIPVYARMTALVILRQERRDAGKGECTSTNVVVFVFEILKT